MLTDSIIEPVFIYYTGLANKKCCGAIFVQICHHWQTKMRWTAFLLPLLVITIDYYVLVNHFKVHILIYNYNYFKHPSWRLQTKVRLERQLRLWGYLINVPSSQKMERKECEFKMSLGCSPLKANFMHITQV